MEQQKIKDCLRNLYINFAVDAQGFVWPSYRTKCVGVMEGLLLALGVIQPGQPFQYGKTTSYFFFGLIPIRHKETYEDHILRLTYETIKQD
jgi:hypothetical protein